MLKDDEYSPLIIGHRGCPHSEPENTLRSFKRALDHGADMIELDVHLTKDDKLIIMHDGNLARTTGIDKEIRKMTLAEIRSHTAEGETIPTLKETLEFLKGKCMVNIESKNKKTAPFIVDLVKRLDMVDDVILASRSWAFLSTVKLMNPFIRTAWVFERPSLGYILRAKLLGAYALQPHINVTTKRMVQRAHKHNLKVFVWWSAYPLWRINIKKLKKIKADGVITHNTALKF